MYVSPMRICAYLFIRYAVVVRYAHRGGVLHMCLPCVNGTHGVGLRDRIAHIRPPPTAAVSESVAIAYRGTRSICRVHLLCSTADTWAETQKGKG